jgi:twinkle protein
MLSLKHQHQLEARGLDIEVLSGLGVETSEKGPAWLVIPYVQHGDVVNHKFRRVEKRADGINFYQDTAGKKCFWNFDALLDASLTHLPVIITEGEFDAMVAIQCGFPRTVSVPDGAPSKPQGLDGGGDKYAFLDEQTLALLRDAKCIILAVDGDETGANLLHDLSHRLGRHRCKYLRYPKHPFDRGKRVKDLNDVLQAYGAAGVVETVNGAEWVKVDGLYRMSQLPPLPMVGAVDIGIALLGRHFKIRLGDMSVVTGIPGHGKTSLINEIACRMALPVEPVHVLGVPEDTGHGWTIAIASFEQRAQTDLRRNLRQFRGRCHPDYLNAQALRVVDDWIDEHFVLMVPDEDDEATLSWFVERSAAAAVQYGARLVIGDPWNEMDHIRPPDMSLTEYTGFAIKQFRKAASKYQVHWMMAAHPTKIARGRDNVLPCPTLYDVSDSAHWYNKPDAGIIVHRETDSNTLIWVQKTRYEEIGDPGKLHATYLRDQRRFEMIDPEAKL